MILCCAQSYNVSATFFFFFSIFTKLPVKDVQLKPMNEKKSKIPSLTPLAHLQFQLEKFTQTKTNFFQKFMMGNVDNFSPLRSHLEYFTVFSTILSGYFYVCCIAKSL